MNLASGLYCQTQESPTVGTPAGNPAASQKLEALMGYCVVVLQQRTLTDQSWKVMGVYAGFSTEKQAQTWVKTQDFNTEGIVRDIQITSVYQGP